MPSRFIAIIAALMVALVGLGVGIGFATRGSEQAESAQSPRVPVVTAGPTSPPAKPTATVTQTQTVQPPIVVVPQPGPTVTAVRPYPVPTYYDSSGPYTTLQAMITGINDGDYATAYAQFDARMQARLGSLEHYASGLRTSNDTGLSVNSVSGSASGLLVNATFQSTQAAGTDPNHPSETCTNWDINYGMVPGGGAGGWLIDSTELVSRSPCLAGE